MSDEYRQSSMDQFVDPSPGIIASVLAPQLGSDIADRMEGKYDMRRLTVIEKEQLGLIMYATIRSQKSRAWGTILDVVKNWGVSVGGRGRRDIIRMEAVSKGLPTSVEGEIQKPGWFGRNIYQRDWERAERERLGLE